MDDCLVFAARGPSMVRGYFTHSVPLYNNCWWDLCVTARYLILKTHNTDPLHAVTVQLRRCEITVRVWNVLSVLLFYSWHKYFWNLSVTFYVFSQLDQREPFLSYDASFCLVCESAAAWNNYKHLICNMVGQHVIWTVSFPVQRVAVPSMCKITHTAFLWSDCKYYFSSCCCKMVVDIFISWRKCTHIQKEDVENSHKTNVGNSISPNHGFPEYAVMDLVTGSCPVKRILSE